MNTVLPSRKSLLAGASAFAVALGVAGAQTAFTTPVGYHTETVKQGYNVIGVNLVEAPLVSSSLTAVAGTLLTDANNGINIAAALQPAGATFSIEFANGAWGVIASATANSVTTTTNISASLDATAANNKYVIRKVKTLGDLFGDTNSAGLKQGGATTADVVWIPKGAAFDKAYYAAANAITGATAGWRLVGGGNTDQKGYAVPVTAGLIIEKKDAGDLNLTFTGHVKLTKTQVAVDAPYTYLSRVYPTGSTLGNSGLDASVVKGAATAASNIWLAKGPSAFDKAYFANANAIAGVTAGWKLVGGGNTDQAGTALTSGFILERRKDAFTATLTPPDFYSSL